MLDTNVDKVAANSTLAHVFSLLLILSPINCLPQCPITEADNQLNVANYWLVDVSMSFTLSFTDGVRCYYIAQLIQVFVNGVCLSYNQEHGVKATCSTSTLLDLVSGVCVGFTLCMCYMHD